MLRGIEKKCSGALDKRARGEGDDAFLVAPAEAGAHASKQEWILACGGMTESSGNDGPVVS